jgi:hypothetical protein
MSFRRLTALNSLTQATACRSAPRRFYQHTTRLRLPYKDDQDRESLKPRSTEHTKSSTDEDLAAHDDAAFNPNKTRPETEQDTAAVGADGNPLNASGANQDISKPQGDNPGGKEGAPDKQRRSGGGSAPKGGPKGAK